MPYPLPLSPSETSNNQRTNPKSFGENLETTLLFYFPLSSSREKITEQYCEEPLMGQMVFASCWILSLLLLCTQDVKVFNCGTSHAHLQLGRAKRVTQATTVIGRSRLNLVYEQIHVLFPVLFFCWLTASSKHLYFLSFDLILCHTYTMP